MRGASWCSSGPPRLVRLKPSSTRSSLVQASSVRFFQGFPLGFLEKKARWHNPTHHVQPARFSRMVNPYSHHPWRKGTWSKNQASMMLHFKSSGVYIQTSFEEVWLDPRNSPPKDQTWACIWKTPATNCCMKMLRFMFFDDHVSSNWITIEFKHDIVFILISYIQVDV